MFLNLLLLSLLPLALGASTAPFLNPAFCNPAGADPSAMRVCFLNPSRQYIFQGYSSGLNVVYSADKNYALVTLNARAYDGMLDSNNAVYTLTKKGGSCTDVKIQYKKAGSWAKQVCNGDDFVIVAV